MRIGEFADRAGVNIQTIRFYERRQLLKNPVRTASGYRDYADADLEKVRFIKRSQELGFTLNDIKAVLRLHDAVAALPQNRRGRSKELREIIGIATERLEHVRAKLDLLKMMERQLRGMIRQLSDVEQPVCPAAKM